MDMMRLSQDKTLTTPAFWDLHIHGAFGHDFMKITPQQVISVCEKLGHQGIGAFAPTLLTASEKSLELAVKNWGEILSDLHGSDISLYLSEGAAIPIGLHLEGPFLNPSMAGAHPRNAIKKPSVKYLKHLHLLSHSNIKIITIAPELDGSLELIKMCRQLGIRVQMGHTQAITQQICDAVKIGASGVTHLYNAMHIHHREPSFIPFLISKKLTAEIITDTLHLNSGFIHFLLQSGISKSLYSVTDACSALGCGSKNRSCTLGDLKVQKEGIGAYVQRSNILAGSAVPLSSHPYLLKKAWTRMRLPSIPARLFFPLFYAHQQKLFPKIASMIKGKTNVFNERDWKFIP